MDVLDLFSGTNSFSAAFEKSRDWAVYSVDLNPDDLDEINPDLEADILDLDVADLPEDFQSPDVVLASPPCKAFSLAAAHHHMTEDVEPKTDFGRESIQLVKTTIELIDELDPQFSFIENPRSGTRRVMRNKPWGLGEPTGTVSWCQYGYNRMKPTDLWGDHPDSLKYRFCGNGEDCHASATRGSQTGTQGMSSAVKRAAIPFGLSLSILESVERAMQKT